MKFDLKASGVCKRESEVGCAKNEKRICKTETDKVMMVWENVLLPQLRNIHSDSVNGESVYSNSMVTEMSSLLANTLCRCTFIYTHTHMHTFVLISLW